MVKWGMVIDLERCIGCHACTEACKAENFVQPDNFWNRVIDQEKGKYPNVWRLFFPLPCQHCENPPCVKACPTGAMYKRKDGIVLIDYEKCKGYKYCRAACPYGVIYFIPESVLWNPGKPTPYEELPYELRHPTHRKKAGTCEKCTFCVHRVEEGIKRGLKPGIDREATPACVVTCLGLARHFGDLDDPTSKVSKIITEKRGYQFKPEFGTRPQVYYIPAHERREEW